MKIPAIILTIALTFTVMAQEPSKPRKLEEKMLAWAFLEAAGTHQTIDQTLLAVQEAQFKALPAHASLQAAVKEYLHESISYDASKEDLAEIHLQVYTLDELRELIRFYQSPIGRKHASAGAPIAEATAALIQRKLEENLPRFQIRMQQILQAMATPETETVQPQTK